MNKICINCPWCYSGNIFKDTDIIIYKCDDCGAILNRTRLRAEGDNINKCIFCRCDFFYWEYPFSLPLFRKRLTCYVCEAEYIGFVINKDIKKYNEQTLEEIKNTAVYKDWKEYWKQYDPWKEEDK